MSDSTGYQKYCEKCGAPVVWCTCEEDYKSAITCLEETLARLVRVNVENFQLSIKVESLTAELERYRKDFESALIFGKPIQYYADLEAHAQAERISDLLLDLAKQKETNKMLTENNNIVSEDNRMLSERVQRLVDANKNLTEELNEAKRLTGEHLAWINTLGNRITELRAELAELRKAK